MLCTFHVPYSADIWRLKYSHASVAADRSDCLFWVKQQQQQCGTSTPLLFIVWTSRSYTFTRSELRQSQTITSLYLPLCSVRKTELRSVIRSLRFLTVTQKTTLLSYFLGFGAPHFNPPNSPSPLALCHIISKPHHKKKIAEASAHLQIIWKTQSGINRLLLLQGHSFYPSIRGWRIESPYRPIQLV